MSRSFPILSGSPPPYDDGPPPLENGFSDDDDDFGSFTAVPFTAPSLTETTNRMDSIPESDFTNFAQFQTHTDEKNDNFISNNIDKSVREFEENLVNDEASPCKDSEENCEATPTDIFCDSGLKYCEQETEISMEIYSDEGDSFDEKEVANSCPNEDVEDDVINIETLGYYESETSNICTNKSSDVGHDVLNTNVQKGTNDTNEDRTKVINKVGVTEVGQEYKDPYVQENCNVTEDIDVISSDGSDSISTNPISLSNGSSEIMQSQSVLDSNLKLQSEVNTTKGDGETIGSEHCDDDHDSDLCYNDTTENDTYTKDEPCISESETDFQSYHTAILDTDCMQSVQSDIENEHSYSDGDNEIHNSRGDKLESISQINTIGTENLHDTLSDNDDVSKHKSDHIMPPSDTDDINDTNDGIDNISEPADDKSVPSITSDDENQTHTINNTTDDLSDKNSDSNDVERPHEFEKEKSDDSFSSEEITPRRRQYSEDEDLTFRVSTSEDRENLDEIHTDNDFQDFAAFPSSPTENDDWANFESAADFDTHFPDTIAVDDFGDFSENVAESKLDLEDDEDFGDFTETRSSTSTVSITSLTQPLTSVISGCFPDEPINGDTVLDEQLDILTELVTTVTEAHKPTASELSTPGWSKDTRSGGSWMEEVWTSLAQFDGSSSISYQWHESCSNKKMFHTLNIDARNILHLRNRKQLVPLFASNLGTGVLEPTKEVASAKPKEEEALVDTNKSVPASSPTDLPPVDFDWSMSGLTNPLDSPSSHFLEINMSPSKSRGAKSSKVFNPAIPTGDLASVSHKPLQSVDEILKAADDKNATTIKPQMKDENLSDESSKIIASLPDLVFMKTKVLMFAMK